MHAQVGSNGDEETGIMLQAVSGQDGPARALLQLPTRVPNYTPSLPSWPNHCNRQLTNWKKKKKWRVWRKESPELNFIFSSLLILFSFFFFFLGCLIHIWKLGFWEVLSLLDGLAGVGRGMPHIKWYSQAQEARDCRCRRCILIGGCVTGTRSQQVTSIDRGGQHVIKAHRVTRSQDDHCSARWTSTSAWSPAIWLCLREKQSVDVSMRDLYQVCPLMSFLEEREQLLSYLIGQFTNYPRTSDRRRDLCRDETKASLPWTANTESHRPLDGWSPTAANVLPTISLG